MTPTGTSSTSMLGINSTFVVIATPEEYKLTERFPELRNLPVIITGVGGVKATWALRNIPRESDIINVGYAGSVDLPIGEAYPVGDVSLYHPNFPGNEPYIGLPREKGCVHCFTSSDFVLSAREKGCVFDMELAFIAAMGFRSVRSIKVVSDHCDLDEYTQTIENGKD